MSGNNDPRPGPEKDWEGLQEIDRAISENRLTAYSWKKAWADPWGRAKIITALAFLCGLCHRFVIDLRPRALTSSPLLHFISSFLACARRALRLAIHISSYSSNPFLTPPASPLDFIRDP